MNEGEEIYVFLQLPARVIVEPRLTECEAWGLMLRPGRQGMQG
jgi:hypothetical protein